MADEKYWRNRASSDRADGRDNSNMNLISDTRTVEESRAYQAGWGHTSGQTDKAEGRSSRAGNLVFHRPADLDAYQKGYDGVKVKKGK